MKPMKEWAENVEREEEKRNTYTILLFGKRTGKRPLGRLRCRWEDNVKIDSVSKDVG
jgi:hypothetical protein